MDSRFKEHKQKYLRFANFVFFVGFVEVLQVLDHRVLLEDHVGLHREGLEVVKADKFNCTSAKNVFMRLLSLYLKESDRTLQCSKRVRVGGSAHVKTFIAPF